MSAALAKRVQKRGSPLRLTNACSADLRAGTDCVEKRELHRDVLFDETKYRDTLHLTNWPDQRSGRSPAANTARSCAGRPTGPRSCSTGA